MSQPVQTFNFRTFLSHHLEEVFQTMLATQAVLVEQPPVASFPERVSGAVGLGGEHVKAVVYLHLSAAFAAQGAAAMLGMNPGEQPSDAEINDVVGELTNMVAGGLKSALCDQGLACAVSTPSIIRGTAFEIESLPGVTLTQLTFACGAHQVLLELHFQPQ
jgi:CheY-specific phosphatase CheX